MEFKAKLWSGSENFSIPWKSAFVGELTSSDALQNVRERKDPLGKAQVLQKTTHWQGTFCRVNFMAPGSARWKPSRALQACFRCWNLSMEIVRLMQVSKPWKLSTGPLYQALSMFPCLSRQIDLRFRCKSEVSMAWISPKCPNKKSLAFHGFPA